MHITRTAINKMDKITRLNLINSLGGYKQPNLIGTKGNDNVENIAIFSSVVHFGSNPPLLGMVTRPNVTPRNTYQNIKETGHFTINMVSNAIVEQAHQTSAKYPKQISEFKKVNLTPVYLNKFPAPYVLEAPIKIGLKTVEEHDIKVNDTRLIIGEIIDLHIAENALENDGIINLSKLNITASSGLNTYYKTEKLIQLPYARPH